MDTVGKEHNGLRGTSQILAYKFKLITKMRINLLGNKNKTESLLCRWKWAFLCHQHRVSLSEPTCEAVSLFHIGLIRLRCLVLPLWLNVHMKHCFYHVY